MKDSAQLDAAKASLQWRGNVEVMHVLVYSRAHFARPIAPSLSFVVAFTLMFESEVLSASAITFRIASRAARILVLREKRCIDIHDSRAFLREQFVHRFKIRCC